MTDLSPEALALYRSYKITDPDVVLALCDALEEARAEIERLKPSAAITPEITGEDKHESTFDRDRRRSWIEPHSG